MGNETVDQVMRCIFQTKCKNAHVTKVGYENVSHLAKNAMSGYAHHFSWDLCDDTNFPRCEFQFDFFSFHRRFNRICITFVAKEKWKYFTWYLIEYWTLMKRFAFQIEWWNSSICYLFEGIEKGLRKENVSGKAFKSIAVFDIDSPNARYLLLRWWTVKKLIAFRSHVFTIYLTKQTFWLKTVAPMLILFIFSFIFSVSLSFCCWRKSTLMQKQQLDK